MIEARRDMASTVFGVLNEEEQEQLEMLLSKLISELEKTREKSFQVKIRDFISKGGEMPIFGV